MFENLFLNGIQLVTKVKNSMSDSLMSIADKILLRKKVLIETVSNELNNIAQIEHSNTVPSIISLKIIPYPIGGSKFLSTDNDVSKKIAYDFIGQLIGYGMTVILHSCNALVVENDFILHTTKFF